MMQWLSDRMKLEAKYDSLNNRYAKLNERFDSLAAKYKDLDKKKEITELSQSELKKLNAELQQKINSLEASKNKITEMQAQWNDRKRQAKIAGKIKTLYGL